MTIYGTPITMGGGGGQNSDLPPLLDNFKATRADTNVVLSADRMDESRATNLAGAVWVYGEHEPKNITDGTKLEITRDEILNAVPKARASEKTVGDLTSNSKIKLGRYAGKELQWLVCRNAENKLFLILATESVGTLGNKMFDNAEPSNPNNTRKQSGNNTYSLSNIHQWLNSNKSANSWYEKKHTYDAPPDYTNHYGFLKDWTNSELHIVLNTQWTTTKDSVDGGGFETFQSKISLPSMTEMGLETGTGGLKLDIFKTDSDRAIGKRYWCRTSYPNVPSSAKIIGDAGTSYGGSSVIDPWGIRPICSIPETTPISDTPDSDNCYTIIFAPPLGHTVAWDKKKEFYARQFTYNSKKQYQTMLDGAMAYLPIVPDSQELSKLPSKSKVKLGKFNGTPLKWLVCRDSVDQSLRLILDAESVRVVGDKRFDVAEPQNSDAGRQKNGNSRYIWSNIHQWLNSSDAANRWYSARHSKDAPPDYTNIAGFLREWTIEEINMLENADWIVEKHSLDGGGTETFSSRITLPSISEMGLQYHSDGVRLDIFNNNFDRGIDGVYWSRTPSNNSSDHVHCVWNDGSLDVYSTLWLCNTALIRPLCKPIPTTLVSPQPDNEGCYTLI